MQAPKCRVCGEREWNHVCQTVVEVSAELPAPEAVTSSEEPSLLAAEQSKAQARSAAERTQRWRAANRERYNEYMRDYRSRQRAHRERSGETWR